MKKNIKIISIMLFLLSVATVSAVTMGFTIGPGFAQPLYTDTNDNVKLLESSEEKLESNIEPKMVFDIEEVRCLAENIYHEARNQLLLIESLIGDSRIQFVELFFKQKQKKVGKRKVKKIYQMQNVYFILCVTDASLVGTVMVSLMT